MTVAELIHAIYSIFGANNAVLHMITDNYVTFEIDDKEVCIQKVSLECTMNNDGHGGVLSDSFTRSVSAKLHRYRADRLEGSR